MIRTVLIAALRAEARAFECAVDADDEIEVVVSGVGLEAATRAARSRPDAGAFVSWGCSGGLVPTLRAGDIVIPEVVVDAAGNEIPVDFRWRDQIARGAGEFLGDGLRAVSLDAAVTGPADKQAFARRFGAATVDMESAAVGAVARERGVPFLVVRAVADPSHARVPGWALTCLRPDGGVDVRAILRGLCRAPGDLPALARNGRDFRQAIRALTAFASRTSGSLRWRASRG